MPPAGYLRDLDRRRGEDDALLRRELDLKQRLAVSDFGPGLGRQMADKRPRGLDHDVVAGRRRAFTLSQRLDLLGVEVSEEFEQGAVDVPIVADLAVRWAANSRRVTSREYLRRTVDRKARGSSPLT